MKIGGWPAVLAGMGGRDGAAIARWEIPTVGKFGSHRQLALGRGWAILSAGRLIQPVGKPGKGTVTTMSAELLEQAIALAQAGKQQEARELLVQVITADVHDEKAWLWYWSSLPTREDTIEALEKCLYHNPACAEASNLLAALKAGQPLPQAADLEPSEPKTLHTEEGSEQPVDLRGKAQTKITEPQRMKSRPFSRALPPFFRGLVMFLGVVALLSAAYLIGRGDSRPDERIILSPSPLPALSSTVSPEEAYARAMQPALRELNQWFDGPQRAWDNLMAPLPAGVRGKSHSDLLNDCLDDVARGAIYGPRYCPRLAQAGAISILESISAEGFGVLGSLGGAAPPDAIRVAHSKVEACVEFEINRASALARAITDFVITDLGPNPCNVFPEALDQMEQYVQDHQ